MPNTETIFNYRRGRFYRLKSLSFLNRWFEKNGKSENTLPNKGLAKYA